MKTLLKETKASFEQFSSRWKSDLVSVSSQLATHPEIFLRSYRRIASLQAWRTIVLEEKISPGSFAFFLEAQNDALTSHVLAALGSRRSALKALRSCAENVLFCLYYMDHPVELQLWRVHEHKFTFSEAMAYLQKHPLVHSLPASVTGLTDLENEYSKLSAAVHASAESFRMTEDGQFPTLWDADTLSLGSWATQERRVVTSINLLFLTVFRSEVQGAKLPSLRKAVSLVIPSRKHARVRSNLRVQLFRA